MGEMRGKGGWELEGKGKGWKQKIRGKRNKER